MPAKAPPLLGQRDDGRGEADTPGPLGWARTTRLNVRSQIWVACVHPTMTTSTPSLTPRSSSLGVPPSSPSRPSAPEWDHPQRMEAGANVYKTSTSHPSWLSFLDNHSTREKAPFQGSVASWVAVVLFEPPSTDTHTPTPPRRHQDPKQPCLTASTARI